MTHRLIKAFVEEFLPDVEPPGPGLRLIPHSLLYDFVGHYKGVRFTSEQLIHCLDGYLALIEPVIAFVQAQPVPFEGYRIGGELYGIGHDDASELLLAYFQRTPIEQAFLDHIVEVDAVAQVERLLEVVDPDGVSVAMDAVKRIYSIRGALQHWQAG